MAAEIYHLVQGEYKGKYGSFLVYSLIPQTRMRKKDETGKVDLRDCFLQGTSNFVDLGEIVMIGEAVNSLPGIYNFDRPLSIGMFDSEGEAVSDVPIELPH